MNLPKLILVISFLSLSPLAQASNFSQFFSGGSKTRASQEFTAGGTWTKPSGVTAVDVECIGGGGGGGKGSASGSSSYLAFGGGGGSSGIYVAAKDVHVTGNVVVTIGFGGAGSTSAAGADGTASSFGTLVIAEGGAGGMAGQNELTSSTFARNYAGASRIASGVGSQSAPGGSLHMIGGANGALVYPGGSIFGKGGTAGTSTWPEEAVAEAVGWLAGTAATEQATRMASTGPLLRLTAVPVVVVAELVTSADAPLAVTAGTAAAVGAKYLGGSNPGGKSSPSPSLG